MKNEKDRTSKFEEHTHTQSKISNIIISNSQIINKDKDLNRISLTLNTLYDN